MFPRKKKPPPHSFVLPVFWTVSFLFFSFCHPGFSLIHTFGGMVEISSQVVELLLDGLKLMSAT